VTGARQLLFFRSHALAAGILWGKREKCTQVLVMNGTVLTRNRNDRFLMSGPRLVPLAGAGEGERFRRLGHDANQEGVL
jgi:hypothetical protein